MNIYRIIYSATWYRGTSTSYVKADTEKEARKIFLDAHRFCIIEGVINLSS